MEVLFSAVSCEALEHVWVFLSTGGGVVVVLKSTLLDAERQLH